VPARPFADPTGGLGVPARRARIHRSPS
jgi:hypothetical protein